METLAWCFVSLSLTEFRPGDSTACADKVRYAVRDDKILSEGEGTGTHRCARISLLVCGCLTRLIASGWPDRQYLREAAAACACGRHCRASSDGNACHAFVLSLILLFVGCYSVVLACKLRAEDTWQKCFPYATRASGIRRGEAATTEGAINALLCCPSPSEYDCAGQSSSDFDHQRQNPTSDHSSTVRFRFIVSCM